MRKYLSSFFVFILAISFVGAVVIGNGQGDGVVIKSPDNFSPAGNSSGNGTDITSASANQTYWKLDGTNAPPSASWNMGNFGLRNVGNTSFVRNIYFNTTSSGEWGGIMNVSAIIGASTITDTKLFPEDGASSNAGFVIGRLNTLYYDAGLAFPYVYGAFNYINNSKATVISVTNPVMIFGSNNVLNGTRYNGVSVFGSNNNILNPINRSIYVGYGGNYLWINATFASFNNNVYAPNLCYSDGTNCTASAGNSTFNQSLTDLLYSPIKWAYNQTQPFTDWLSTFAFNYNQTTVAVDTAQNYTNNYYASQGSRQTICFSMGALANNGFLSFGGLAHTATQGFTPLHNGSILGATVQWSQTGGAIIAGNEVNGSYYLNVSRTTVFQNNMIFVQTGSSGRFINTATRGQYNFTDGDNVTVSYVKTAGTGSIGVRSYCVEYVYDQ